VRSQPGGNLGDSWLNVLIAQVTASSRFQRKTRPVMRSERSTPIAPRAARATQVPHAPAYENTERRIPAMRGVPTLLIKTLTWQRWHRFQTGRFQTGTKTSVRGRASCGAMFQS